MTLFLSLDTTKEDIRRTSTWCKDLGCERGRDKEENTEQVSVE